MKKILALTLTGIMAVAGAAMFASCKKKENLPPQENVYFVPGTYMSDGVKVENTIPSGAVKLSAEDCEEMYTENVYQCALPAGANMPVPSTDRKDGEGKGYTFNGWWTIVNATVTYYETVPATSETTIFYADWRAALSLPMDPVNPEAGPQVEPDHYLLITHADKTVEKVTLRYTGSDMNNAETLGYGFPVELFNQGLQLSPGDTFVVYTTGLTDDEEAVQAPVPDRNKYLAIQLDKNGSENNDTADFLEAAELTDFRITPKLTYIGEEAGDYNIYIKFYSGGSIMAVYMEPME